MKSLTHEVWSVLTVLAFPAAVLAVFPFEALSFKGKDVQRDVGLSSAFISLDAEQEREAMRLSRTSWRRGEASYFSHRYIQLGGLPEDDSRRPIDVGFVPRTEFDTTQDFPFCPFEPSSRAAPPQAIPQLPPEKPTLPFSRAELLKL